MKTKQEKGITLIALIITVIVMLILVGVVLTISIGDNGLVNRANYAKEQTEIAMDRELLLSAVVGAIGIDGKVNLSAIVLPEGFTGSNGTYTSANGHTFTVSENGDVKHEGSEEPTVETVDLNGKYYSDMSATGYWEFTNNSTLTIVNENKTSVHNILQWDVDTTNKTLTIKVDSIESGNTIEVEPYDTYTFKYDIIKQNGVIVNKTLYLEAEDILFSQNQEGL